MTLNVLLVPLIAWFLYPLAVLADPPKMPYRPMAEIPIPGKGGWDYLTIDPEGHRLYASHSDRLIVIDTEKNKVIHEIAGLPGVHGIALAADLNKGFSSNGREGMIRVIDLQTFAPKSTIKVGENPDAIVYEPSRQEVYAFNWQSKSASIIDAKTEKVVTTLELPGKPEFAVLDPKTRRVFVNIEETNSVVAVDAQSHKIVSNWALQKCESPTGLAIDVQNRRLFSVCKNQCMVILDIAAANGRIVASVPIGEGADGAAFDPDLMLAFSSNGGTGTVTIVHEDTPEKFVVVGNLKTQKGARTMALNPKDHRIYLTSAEFRDLFGRPFPIDGTQKVLVYGP